MKIIDVHAHLGLSVSDGGRGDLEELNQLMRSNHITRTIIFPIDSESPGGTYERFNDEILRIVEKHPERFSGLCRVQPKSGSKAARELLRCWKAGLKGLKLHTKSENFLPKDCHAVLEVANELKCPVMVHTDNSPHKQGPQVWKPIIEKYSDAIFILAHAGKDYFHLAAEMAKTHSNVYVDTSTLSYRRTGILLEVAGPEKILFASDYPYSHPLLELKKYDLLVQDKGALRMIMSENAERIWNFNL